MEVLTTPAEVLAEKGHKWTVHTKIEKYNDDASVLRGVPDEVQEIENNMLLNQGINLLWSLVAGAPGLQPFNAANAHIGVGNNDDGTVQPSATDAGLKGPLKMYMKMDDEYPKYGDNQKIVFRSTFNPGVACFNWYEWTVANGNGNHNGSRAWDQDEVRTQAVGDDPIPDPLPVEHDAWEYGVGEENVINLNRRQENMGKKYASATWIVTVEISLS